MELLSHFPRSTRWSSPNELAARIHGVIEHAEMWDAQSFRPAPGGLFDESTFGELSADGDAEAQFEFLREVFARETIQPNAPLASRFGVVRLPEPIVHPLVWTRDRGHLAQAAGWSVADLTALVLGDVGIDRMTGRLTAVTEAQPSVLDGPRAVVRALAEHPSLTIDRVLVMPVAARPQHSTVEGGIVVAEVNDLYRRVLTRRNRLAKLTAMAAPEPLLRGERIKLFQDVVALFDNALAPDPIVRDDRPLTSLFGLVSEPALRVLSGPPTTEIDLRALAALRAIEAMGFSVPAWS